MDTKKLRQKILDLAIRGKLVPQDPNDEPASPLLQRIRDEKERLIKEGKIKRSKKAAADEDIEAPFEIPESWEWCIVDDFAYVASGSTPSKDAFVEKGIPYIKMYNLRNQKIDFDFHPQYIKPEVHNGKLQRSRTEVGDLIMNIVGPPLGKMAIIPQSLPESNFNQAAVLIRPHLYKEILVKYLFYYLSQMSEINSISTKGSAGQLNISLTQSQNMRIALPPLAEQQRIVNEVERWFAVIDALESNEGDLLKAIDQAKSKILDLAIHGKLVPQDPNDEPAIELLKRINPKFEACDNEDCPFEIPTSWEWTTLGVISNYGNTTNIEINNIPQDAWVLELEDLEKDSAIVLKRVTKRDREIKGVRHSFKNGDVLYSKLRTYLNKVLVAPEDGYCTTEIIPISFQPSIHSAYINHVLRSRYFLDYTIQCGYGVKMPRLSTADARKGLIPIPPYKEQLRIVAKIEELFGILDGIKEALEA